MPATILRPILKIPINENVEQLKIVLIYPVQDMGGASKSLMSKNVHIIYAQKMMDLQEGYLTLFVKLSIIYEFTTSKVDIFWEGHKILRNLHLTFDCMYCSQK